MMKYVVCWRSVGIVKIGLQVDYCVICVLLYLLADDNCFHLHAIVESKKQVSSLLWMLLEFGAVGLTFKATSLLQAIFFYVFILSCCRVWSTKCAAMIKMNL